MKKKVAAILGSLLVAAVFIAGCATDTDSNKIPGQNAYVICDDVGDNCGPNPEKALDHEACLEEGYSIVGIREVSGDQIVVTCGAPLPKASKR